MSEEASGSWDALSLSIPPADPQPHSPTREVPLSTPSTHIALQSGTWEAISFINYPTIRNVQSIDIYNVNPGQCHAIQNWIARLRRRIPHHELGINGMETHFDDPGYRFEQFGSRPEFVVRIMGDMVSVTERGLVAVLYPKNNQPEIVYVAEPSKGALDFDVDIRSWHVNGNMEPLITDFNFLTAEKEQLLLDLASRWVISRRVAWTVEEGDGPRALDLLGIELRQLCERSMERTLSYVDEGHSEMGSSPEYDEDEALYSDD
ncbi:hypothetical protein EV356DRAFT_203251 [Viridothelium virens]|uniref:Uncharacterized protein n=1 Tax=Viridothelium virens TaxID=1048519 RepID=A0A6A6H5X4_VIRVR|nr:hypothetical protein EV356DRAFT_203251 [Viridothelium virens]